MIRRIASWIATCGPIGHVKFAPGSLGSIVGLLLVLVASSHFILLIVLFFIFLCVGISSSAVASRELNAHDPPQVVIDEVCGVLVSFIGIPLNFSTVLIGFIGFRFFDILKPPPLRWLERFPSGFGIVLDDVAAGIYTNLILQILIRYAHM
ncbi:MAG: phosphatidylglycerophosphatase A [Candidatus Omnitrophica bacterium]|nr:phosphatidylglycerophosphatase A [Candidatus Omnitrophota bacterium]